MTEKKSIQKQHTEMEEASMQEDSLVISYLLLRKTVGILGMALPIIVALGGLLIFNSKIQSSMSSYYYTGMRDVFVGILWTIGFFLFSYKGYDRRDNIASNLACVFAVIVSLFPTAPDGSTSPTENFIGGVHLFFATLFFLILIYFCLFLFTQTNLNKQSTDEKLKRNVIYRICGYLMIACIVLIAVYKLFFDGPGSVSEALHPVFWLEAIAIFTFGISWFTKGEAILWDK